jgi:protein-disulfide isomerase
MSKVAWIIFTVIIVALVGGLVAYSRISTPSTDVGSINSNSVLAANEQNGQIGDQVYGNKDSTVIFVEYGDFQCPSCAAVSPQIKKALDAYKDRVAFVYRNFPLTTIHPNARLAAAAAEAAGLQGKYWEMHDLLYEEQAAWRDVTGDDRTNVFVNFASQLELDTGKFTSDLGSSEINRKISFDQALGKKVGVSATPSFFLNGTALTSEDSTKIVQGSTSTLTGLFDKALAE